MAILVRLSAFGVKKVGRHFSCQSDGVLHLFEISFCLSACRHVCFDVSDSRIASNNKQSGRFLISTFQRPTKCHKCLQPKSVCLGVCAHRSDELVSWPQDDFAWRTVGNEVPHVQVPIAKSHVGREVRGPHDVIHICANVRRCIMMHKQSRPNPAAIHPVQLATVGEFEWNPPQGQGVEARPAPWVEGR